MNKYEEMSDFEISKEVASALYGVDTSDMKELVYANDKSAAVWSNAWGGMKSFDINNPSHVWPLIEAESIGVQPDMMGDGFWHCYDLDGDVGAKSKNPLRAAAIVYLMIKDAE